MFTRNVMLRPGVRVQQHENGSVSLQIPAQELSPLELETIEKLFPNTGNLIENALTMEALNAAVVKH